MNLVAAADKSGQPIFSKWSSPSDWPADVSYCVMEARRILSYFENLQEEQRPPKAIWHSRLKCAEWIEDHQPGQGSGGSGKLWFKDSEVER